MGTLRVLVVEDDAIIAEHLRYFLAELHHETVGTADTGKDSIQMAETLRPDVVLMDIKLRGAMDGFEAARQIQALHGCPIVYVSSNPAAKEMPYWVPKPFSLPALASVITRAVSD